MEVVHEYKGKLGENRVHIKTKYGLLDITKYSYQKGKNHGIISAINQQEYFENWVRDIRSSENIEFLSSYVGSHKPVIVKIDNISYKLHAFNLLRGKPLEFLCCLEKTKLFIKLAKEIHGDIYDYSKTNYVKSKKEIIITCKIHGDFKQTPNSHLRKSNCPLCSIQRLSRLDIINKKNIRTSVEFANVYCIECSGNDEKFYKIGFTNTSIKRRYAFNSKKVMPYNYKILWIKQFLINSAAEIEFRFHKSLGKYHYIPKVKFAGHLTECYKVIKD